MKRYDPMLDACFARHPGDDQGEIHKTFIRAYPAAQYSMVTPENFMNFPASGID
jgi:hypothetical protein